MKTLRAMILTLITIQAGHAATGGPALGSPRADPRQAQIALNNAKTAFSARDDQKLIAAVKAVLENDQNVDQPRASQALDLLNQAYTRNGLGNLAIAANVPARFGKLRIHFRTYTRGDYIDGSGKAWSAVYTPAVWVEGAADLDVAEIKLSRHQTGFDDLVYIDMDAGLGVEFFALDPLPPTGGTKVLGFARVDLRGQMHWDDPRWKEIRGLYRLQIALNDGLPPMDAFFVVPTGHAEQVPTVVSPADSAVVADLSPTFQIADFHSSNFLPFERRECLLSVNQDSDIANEVGDRPGILNVWRKPVGPTVDLSVPMSLRPFTGSSTLKNGKFHKLIEQASEIRSFGSLEISRDYTLEVPFQVVAP